jgi:autoinducer 2-degrading protein
MELQAVLELLRALDRSEPVIIQTDSAYVIGIFTQWLAAWRRKGMRTSRNAPVENRDLIEAIAHELNGRQAHFEKVPGHAGHRLNELANTKAQQWARLAASELSARTKTHRRSRGGSMYVLIVSAKVKPEQRGRFLEAIEDNAASSVRDEPGCLRFDVVVDNDDPDHYLFYEVYRDQDAFAAHRDSEHFARWRQAAEVCLSEPLEATHTAMVVTRSDRG